ncbi:hypothetical protein [Rhizobium leguminosarum]|uniref:hypothetical protein n=1 Tax=Rhizobium leguminosarum TaxID=384 RepID=UPI0013BC731C|nr:hypothetical protein [Rhizobium leguminosarum]NEI65044.1 hypothetical protein [Rhizobium leguminosarum]
MGKFQVSEDRLAKLNNAAAEFTAVCGSEHYTDAIRFTLRQLVHRSQRWDQKLLMEELHDIHNKSTYDIGLKRYDFLKYIGDSFQFHSAFRYYVGQVLEIMALEQFLMLKGRVLAVESSTSAQAR